MRAVNLNDRVGSKLQFSETRINTAFFEQCTVIALLHNSPVLQYQNPVGAPHGRQPVGDDECRAALHHTFKRLLHFALTLGVKRTRGLVQKKDGRIA